MLQFAVPLQFAVLDDEGLLRGAAPLQFAEGVLRFAAIDDVGDGVLRLAEGVLQFAEGVLQFAEGAEDAEGAEACW